MVGALKHGFNPLLKHHLLARAPLRLDNQVMVEITTEDAGLGSRLKQAMADAKVSVEAVADAADVSVQAVYGWLRTGEIHRDHLPTLRSLVKRSIDWLLTGEEYASLGPAHIPNGAAAWTDDDYALIPRLNVEVAAGGGTTPEVEPAAEPVAFRRSWLKGEGLPVNSLVVLQVRGESMAPRIQRGDILLVDHRDTTITDGKVYVIDNHGLRVKRLFRRHDGQVIVRSDNPLFPEETAPPDVLRIIGRVVWVGGVI